MAEAAITLKLTPSEFDLVREVLDREQKRAQGTANDRHTDIKLRAEERALAARIDGLLGKLR